MTTLEIYNFVNSNIRYKDWSFVVKEKNSVPYLQIQFLAPDNLTGIPDMQHCRKWQLSEWMTVTEIVETCWAAVQRAELHEAAELFAYKGEAIYNRHTDVEKLYALHVTGDALETRTPKNELNPIS